MGAPRFRCELDASSRRVFKVLNNAVMAHRLDFGTSGVLLLALDKKSNGELTKQFQARSVKKRYSAVLFGKVQDREGRVSVPIAKDPANFPRQKICFEQGKEAISHYRVTERILIIFKRLAVRKRKVIIL